MHSRTLAVLATASTMAAGATGLAVAKTTHHAGTKAAPRAVFQQQLASELGVPQSRLRAAAEAAAQRTITELQRDGTIDAARAKRLSARVARSGAAPFAAFGRGRGGARPGPRALAEAVGLSPKLLRAALRVGTPPSVVIQRAGKDPATVRVAVRAAVRTALDKRVAAGRLSAAQADRRADKRAARLTGDQPLRLGRHGG